MCASVCVRTYMRVFVYARVYVCVIARACLCGNMTVRTNSM